MSLPDERSMEPSSPIGRTQSGLVALFVTPSPKKKDGKADRAVDDKPYILAASRMMTGRLDYIWRCTMKNSKGSSAVAKENSQGEQQQPRWFVQRWSTTKINYSMGAASAAAKPLRNMSVGGERNSKPQRVCTITPLLLKPPTLNGLPNSLGCQQHVTRPWVRAKRMK